TLDKAVYATLSVNNLLLPGEKRVAVAANFNADLRFGRAKLYLVTADTDCCDRLVLGMNAFLHRKPTCVCVGAGVLPVPRLDACTEKPRLWQCKLKFYQRRHPLSA